MRTEPVRGTVRMTLDLSLLGEAEVLLASMALSIVPALWLGLAIARWITG